MQENVAVADPLTLVGDGEPHDSPEDGLIDIEVEPENPFSELIVIVEVAEEPGFTAGGAEAMMLKSWKVNVAVEE